MILVERAFFMTSYCGLKPVLTSFIVKDLVTKKNITFRCTMTTAEKKTEG